MPLLALQFGTMQRVFVWQNGLQPYSARKLDALQAVLGWPCVSWHDRAVIDQLAAVRNNLAACRCA